MKQSWVIPDVHGAAKTLDSLLESLALTSGDELYFLGDLVDRGPGSKQVLDTIFELQKSDISTSICLGNHEIAMISSLTQLEIYKSWLGGFGGSQTLESFEVASIFDVPSHYIDLMRGFSSYLTHPNYLLIHAGMDFSLTDPFSYEWAFYHIRKFEVDSQKIGGRKLIHGHTPTKLKEIMDQIASGANRIPLDNGVVYTGSDMGNLLAFNLETQVVTVQPYIG